MTRTVFEVIARDGQWHLVHHGRTLSSHPTMESAIEAARQRSRERQPSRILVHAEDGVRLDDAKSPLLPPAV